jgi:uncharacterized coiled-coil protein SlyX
VAKLVWRVKLVAELQPGVTTETELGRIERDDEASLAELGLRLAEAKQLTAALQAQIVPAQLTVFERMSSLMRGLRQRVGQQGPLSGAVSLAVR